MEGKVESEKTLWVRNELNKRIQMIKNGEMPQKLPIQKPMWQQVQPFFNDLSKISVQE